MDLPHSPRYSGIRRSCKGCWTCRVRRKKCDEKQPVCDGCAALHITCHYGQDKPGWMDGSERQEEMAAQVKREIREAAHRRRIENGPDLISRERVLVTKAHTGEATILTPIPPREQATSRCNLSMAAPNTQTGRTEPTLDPSTTWTQPGARCTLTTKNTLEIINIGRSDTILLTFYLDHVLPFLFPFYRPSPLFGGRSWIFEMMVSSPVLRQATLCQSHYFFSLAERTAYGETYGVWETVLAQTRHAFGVLRQALQFIDSSNITERLPCAARILASIVQAQRFEVTLLSFENCQVHLNAALALFRQLLHSTGEMEHVESFNAVMSRLRPSESILPTKTIPVPSAEQAAFRFSSTLLIFDDIIASTMLQEEPRLYEYHRSLLCTIDSTDSPIDLEAVVGCRNWVLLQIGEIAVLDAWKQRRKTAGNLDVMQLVHRATAIKYALEASIAQLENELVTTRTDDSSLLDVFTTDLNMPSSRNTNLVARVWAHGALLYLFVVVSGWQPANVDVRYHVGRVIELLSCQIEPKALLRTMVWPFCVVGCLAEPNQEAQLRGMVERLQPPSVFGTVRKALEIMENVWRNRDIGDISSRDLAVCFRGEGDLVLLV